MKPTPAQVQAMAEIIKEAVEGDYIWEKVQEVAIECAGDDDALEGYGGNLHELYDEAAGQVQVQVRIRKARP